MIDFVKLATFCTNRAKEGGTRWAGKYERTHYVSILEDNTIQYSTTPHVLHNACKCILMHEMSEIIEVRKGIYKKALDKLDNTKENLYKGQDLTQWGLSPSDLENKMALLKDKQFAFSKMLPNETKRVNLFKAFYGGYLNSIIGEYERLKSNLYGDTRI